MISRVRHLIIIGLLINCTAMSGQSMPASVHGWIKSETGDAIEGVSVVFIPDSIPVVGVSSNAQGQYSISIGAPYMGTLRFTMTGYEVQNRSISLLSGKDMTLNITLKESGVMLSQINIEELAKRATLKGDTIEFNAGAFKVNPDAVAEDLLVKMPGITSENGTIKAQGEEVKKVLVDGKSFFGDDATIALKNIPADVIDKIQIYDKSSDQADFTGFKDSETTKTINIQTKNSASGKKFGKAYIAGGTNQLYNFGGNLNYFKGNQRISLIGSSNNINLQNFSSQDLLGLTTNPNGGQGFGGLAPGGSPMSSSNFLVGQNGGVNKINSLGLQYNNVIGRKIELNTSYFLNQTGNNTTSNTERTYFVNDSTNLYYKEYSRSNSVNTNHRVNLKLTYQRDSLSTIEYTPNFSFQKNQGTSELSNFSQNNSKEITSQLANTSSSKGKGYSTMHNVLYKRKFRKTGRTFSDQLSFSKQENSSIKSLDYVLRNELLDTSFTKIQNATTKANGYSISNDIRFTEPVGKSGQIMVNYTPGYSYSSANRTTQIQNAIDEASSANNGLSNSFTLESLQNKAGLSYRLNKNNNYLTIGSDFQLTSFKTSDLTRQLTTSKNFNRALPKVDYMWRPNKRVFYHFGYFTNLQTPSIDQLQPVIDNSNSSLVSIGNQGLQAEYNHNVMTAFRHVDESLTRTFFAMTRVSFTNNYITSASQTISSDTIIEGIDLTAGSQLKSYTNSNGYRSINSMASYGFPMKAISSNININAAYNNTILPSLINDAKNFSKTNTYSTGVYISSNISSNFDFQIGYTGSLSSTSNTINTASNRTYFSGISKLKLNVTPYKHWNLTSELTNTSYKGLSAGYNKNITLLNLGLGYKFLKNEKAELKLSVYDLLNQNKSIVRNSYSNYVEDVSTNVLNRYFMLTLSYKIDK